MCDNFDDINHVHVDDENDTITQWCPICEAWSMFSPNTPYGTCLCS